jgi:AcrR family transcriptional regulator
VEIRQICTAAMSFDPASAVDSVCGLATSAQARRWAKTGAAQQRILDAATDVFATRGFTAATMADVVAGSGASIYHHFGGKNELFLAIFEQMANAVARRDRMQAAFRSWMAVLELDKSVRDSS